MSAEITKPTALFFFDSDMVVSPVDFTPVMQCVHRDIPAESTIYLQIVVAHDADTDVLIKSVETFLEHLREFRGELTS